MKHSGKVIIAVLSAMFLCISAYAQQAVTGVVKDFHGEALPGVTVLGKLNGKNTGTVTDYQGKYSITVDPGTAVVFSSIGYKTQDIEVGNRAVVDVTLADDIEMMEESVVVGFATQKKVNLTGSVTTLDSESLENIPVRNPVLALQGQIPGLNIKQTSGQMGHNPSINLRGVGTIGEGSSGSVLVLIDGMEGDLFTLNPQDIESISVLKDAAASSIYGSRAPFGVILVTTKKGKEGKMSVNYNNNFRFNSPLNLPSSADSYSWALYFNEGFKNDGKGSFISDERLQRILDYQNGVISYNTIPSTQNSKLWGTAYNDGHDNIDYYDVFFKDQSFAQEHNLSVSGGSKTVNYYVSANYLKEDGLFGFEGRNLDGMQRVNVAGKVEARPKDWLTINYSTRFIRDEYYEPAALSYVHEGHNILWYFGQYLWPVAPLYDPNGILFNDLALRFTQGGTKDVSNTTSSHQFNFVIEPLKNWRIVGDLNYRYNSYYNSFTDKTVWQTAVDGVSQGSVWEDHSGISNDVGRNQYTNINLYTDYENTFAGHYFKVMAGAQAEMFHVDYMHAKKEGLVVPSLPSLDTTTGMFDGEEVSPIATGGSGSWRTLGFFGRLNYNYKERYLLEANLRYDGSSRFAADKRWGLFPSVSLGYNIAKEEFFEPAAAYVNVLKIRASYGSLGNQNTSSYYPTYETMGFANSSGSWLVNGSKPNIAWPASIISSQLTWETVKSWNVGLDFAAFQNRLTGSLEGFIRSTEDMIGPADELPVILGTEVPKTNNTNLVSRGFEFEIAWNDRAFGQLDYGVRFVLADAVTKVTKYSNPSKTLGSYYEGMTLGDFYGFETIGIAKTDDEMMEHLITLPMGGQDAIGSNWRAGDIMYKDLNEDGQIDTGSWTTDDHGDLKIIGNSTPRYNFGLDFNFAWKGIDLRIFFQGVAKRDYFQNGKYFFGSCGWSEWGTMVLDQHLDYFRDNPDDPLGLNLDSYYPRVYLNTEKNVQWQTRYVQDASYIRLKNLSVGYTFPKKWMNKIHVENLRVYFSGENLATFTRMTDLFDPETIGENETGNAYPLQRTLSFGLSVTF